MNNKPKSNSNKLTYLLLATVLLVVIFFAFFGTGDTKNKITYEQANNYFTSQQVEKWYVVGNSKIVFKLTEEAGSEIELKDFPKKYDYYMSHYDEVESMLAEGAQKARPVAQRTLKRLKDAVFGR